EAATTLSRAMSKTTDPDVLRQLAQGLAEAAAQLEPGEAAAVLTQAMVRKHSDIPFPLAHGLKTVAVRVGAGDAGEAAATLNQAMTRTTDPSALEPLALGLTAVAARLEPEDARKVATTLSQVMTTTTNAILLHTSAQGLMAAAARMQPR